VVCQVCKVEYQPTADYKRYSYRKWFQERGEWFNADEGIIEHARRLALLGNQLASATENKEKGLINHLHRTLRAAKHFVHFTTYGISLTFVGALKLASLGVAIRGIVTNADALAVSELCEYTEEAPNLSVHVFPAVDNLRDVPHQKLIVIDGLLALKGSVNLTVQGWRKVQKGLDMLEVVTDVEQVTKLNNDYFAPVWGKVNQQVENPIVMESGIPF